MRVLKFFLSPFFWQSIVFAQPESHAQNPETSQFQDIDEIAAKEETLSYEPTAEFASIAEALRRIEGVSSADSVIMAQETLALFSNLVVMGRDKERILSPEKFEEELLGNKIVFEDAAGKTGHAELNLVDGVKFQRIIHSDSELSICFVPDEKVDQNSKHERRIIAFQHLTAGLSRKDHELGRDVLEVRYSYDAQGNVVFNSTRFFQRHGTWSMGWWRDQALISLYAPNASDIFIAGIFWGVFQVGQTALVNSATHQELFPAKTMNQLIWTGCFGAVCGTFATSIRKFNQIGGKVESLIRNSLTTTIPFLFVFVMLDPERHLNTWGQWGAFLGLEIPIFCLLGNLSKIPIQKLIKMRSDNQLSSDRSFLGVKQSNWEYQTLYNILVFPIRILFLKSNGGLKLKEYIGTNVGYNKLALPLLYPILSQFVAAYAEHINAKTAKKERIEFEKSFAGLATGLPIGSAIDGLFIPKELTAQWLWGDIEPQSLKHSERFVRRFGLQSRAPAYHFGKILSWVGGLIDPEGSSEAGPIVEHRFARTQPTEFPKQRSRVVETFKAVVNAVKDRFDEAKMRTEYLSGRKLSACARGLQSLGSRLQAPFLKKLSSYR